MAVDLAELERFAATDQQRVVAVVARATGDPAGAVDAVQDAVLTCLTAPPSAPVRNLSAWLTTVALNRARDRARASGAEQRALSRLGSAPASVDDRSDELDIDVRRALATLPVQQRRVCELHYLLDQSVEQIAVALAVSPGTVKTHLHRARRSLGAALAAR